MINEGPELLQNISSLSASLFEMSPFLQSDAMYAAPIGYPAVTPMINAVPPLPETLKSPRLKGANALPSHCASPSSLMSFVATKNGNSEGIIRLAHNLSPSRAEAAAVSGKTISAAKSISAQVTDINFFTAVNSLSMY